MDTRREFIKKSLLLTGAAGISKLVPAAVQRAFAIDPAEGSTYLDAEHIVILMQENRSFYHCFGTLRGVRGFNDPRAHILPDRKPVWLQTNAAGDSYAPFRLDIKDTRITWMGSLPHSRQSQVDAYNAGKHDQWLTAKRSGNKQYADLPLTMTTRCSGTIFRLAFASSRVCERTGRSSLDGTRLQSTGQSTSALLNKLMAQSKSGAMNCAGAA